MRKFSILAGLGLGLVLAGVDGAEAQAANPRYTTDKAGTLTQYYETFATKTLARYYEEATFLVKAKVDMESPAEVTGSLDGDVDPADAIPQLPGLPFLPESVQPSPPAAEAGGAQKSEAGENVQSVTLDVLVDTSYSDRDVEFIRNLLAMGARLDENRGDRVTVHEGFFPRNNRSLQDYRKPMDAPPPPQAKADAKSDSDKASAASEPEKPQANPFSAYMDHLPSLIPLVLICLLILACVWMVSRSIAGSSRKDKGGISDRAGPGSESVSRVTLPDMAPAKPAPAAKGPSQEMSAFRPFLVNCFVGSPKHCGQILKSWIQRDAEKGLRDAAAMVASLDNRLMGVLAPELGRDLTQKLEVHLNVGEVPPADELLVMYKEFKREFQNLSSGAMNEDHYKDLFGFLLQLNEQQVMHILRDESLGIAGLVLAQLPPETAGGILQKMDPDNRSKLLIAMGNIDHIPLTVYREIADRLSLKALDVGNMRYVAADGVDSILELIDNLPVNLQFNYVRSISEMDLGLGEKIRNRYITLPELAVLPDKFLASIVQNLDQDTLILAMLHVDEAIRTKVFALLPERMQMMVSGGIDNARDVTPKESEAAQKRILHRIRDEIKLTGRPA